MGVDNGSALLEEQKTAAGKSVLSQYTQLAYYFSLLCFLLVIITLLQTFCLVQITFVFQSQSTLQETKVRDLTKQTGEAQPVISAPVLPVSSSEPVLLKRACSPCPAGWVPQEEKCYLFSEDRGDWISSQYRCLTLGGTVAIIRTEEEQVFLFKKAQSLSQGDSYWLGMRSSSADGSWQWS
ncbi:NKG2-D type II integral membrane protein, partial [Nibea albiflora]